MDVAERAGGRRKKADSLEVPRKKYRQNEITERPQIDKNAVAAIAVALLLILLLVIHIVAGGKQDFTTTTGQDEKLTAADEAEARKAIDKATAKDAESTATPFHAFVVGATNGSRTKKTYFARHTEDDTDARTELVDTDNDDDRS